MVTNAFVFCITIIVVGLGIGILATVTRTSLWNFRLPSRHPVSEYERVEFERGLELEQSSETADESDTKSE